MEDDRSARNPVGKFFGRMNLVLLILILCAVMYLGAVLLHDADKSGEDWQVESDEALTALQAGEWSDAKVLRDALGDMLPVLPGVSMTGEARNAVYDGGAARMVTLTYENGAVITAVRPREASSLLVREGMRVSLRTDVQALRVPALLSSDGDGARCLYFQSGDAAYSFYAPGMTEEEFLLLAQSLQRMN